MYPFRGISLDRLRRLACRHGRRNADARVNVILDPADLNRRHLMPLRYPADVRPQTLFDISINERLSILRAENKIQVYL